MLILPRIRIVRARPRLGDHHLVDKPIEAAALFYEYIGNEDREFFVTAMLTTRHRLIGIQTIAIGCLSSCLAHPREVFRPAIMASASAIVLGHNHPSGDPEPSHEDVALTARLSNAGKMLGIEVCDHVIVGDPGRYYSFKEKGLIT